MHDPRTQQLGWQRIAVRACWWLAVLLPLVLTVPGCGGCKFEDPATVAKKKKEKEEEEKKKKSEKPKEAFESAPFVIEPGEGKATSNVVKPGHWVTASQAFKSNNLDVVGEFESSAVDAFGRPLEMDHAPFRMLTTRAGSLPAGQTKHFEFLYYVPRQVQMEAEKRKTQLQTVLTDRGGRELYRPRNESTDRMPAYQYHLLVLASDPDRYGYVKRLESVHPKADPNSDRANLQYYRVSLPKVEKRVPLPHHPLAWTSVAYVVWDGIDPSLLSPEQQTGLIDWLHWGGQLVVSGPDSLEQLRGSFLEPYLPMESVKAIELSQEAFQELNDHWSLEDKKQKKRMLNVTAGNPPLGIETRLLEDAQYVPLTGNLVAERRVGRGRVAATAFSLSSRTIINWGSLDNFFNGVILRRPQREFVKSSDPDDLPNVDWVSYSGRRTDPRLITTLRYFSRDIGFLSGSSQRTYDDPQSEIESDLIQGSLTDEEKKTKKVGSIIHPAENDWHFDGYTYDAENESGVGGWSDFSAASDEARDVLIKAAGVSIPKADFVLRVIAVYLLVLVPLNWGFFRLIGRVEWAWVAAPLIAIGGAVAVVRLAQLDIGFVRSQSEVAILEMHAGHKRAHVTRYMAFYSSLSTNYDLAFTDANAVAQPFPKKVRSKLVTELGKATPTTCYLNRDEGVRLKGFSVRSASTEFSHAEQMLPVGNGLQLVGDDDAGWSVENQTSLTIRDAAVFRARPDGLREVCYLGEVKPKQTKTLAWTTLSSGSHPKQWEKSVVMTAAEKTGPTEISLHRLVDLALGRLVLQPGQMRLVGWLDVPLPGLEVIPAASQVNSRTLVLAHLREAPLPAPTPDKNLRVTLFDEEDMKRREANEAAPPPDMTMPPTTPPIPPTP